MAMARGPDATRFVRVTKTIRPGQPGSLKLARRFGAALLCVRYREDGPGQQRCTTVELVVEEGPVQRRPGARTLVQVRIGAEEFQLRHRARALGARWDGRSKCYTMSVKTARALGLLERAAAKNMGRDGN